MGNGPSSRRNGRIQHNQNPVPPPRMVPPPPGYPGSHAPYPGPALYPSNGHHSAYLFPSSNYNGGMAAPMGPPQFYPHGYMPSNGQYMMNLQSQGFRSGAPNSSGSQSHTPPPVTETQKASTIRNDVNLKKATLRLEKDEENPSLYVVVFSFDATVDGCVSICYLCKEKDQCSFTPQKPHLSTVARLPFEKGLAQKFQQPSGSGVNLALFDERELAKEENSIYPLVVRTETLGKDPPANFSLYDELPIGAPVPKWVHCQTTQAIIEKKDDGTFKVRVIRQTLWVEGRYYELQEIYGIENAGVGTGFDGNDAGKECVICMSEPRDTTVLPCRHMCMCSECAKMLRFQTNRCPICRTPVDKLLEINVPKTDNYDDSYGASASQSSSQPGVGQSSEYPNVDRTSSFPMLEQRSSSGERAAKEEIKV
ncbi:unnamed protein product [Calypogeia fissa]